MATKFNIEAFKAELQNRIDNLQDELESIEGLKDWTIYERRESLEEEIQDLTLELNPRYLCEFMWTDRHAYEFIERQSKDRILVRQLKAKRIDNNGMSESQEYEFSQDETRPVLTLRRHKNGCWYTAGGCNPFCFTVEPYEYYDFSF